MISVLVPSYKRPEQLASCLGALALQTTLPDQVVVVRRDIDEATAQVLAGFEHPGIELTVVVVEKPGVIHAMAEGLRATTGDIVALTDDDAVFDPGLDREADLNAFQTTQTSSPSVGGIFCLGYPPLKQRVGLISSKSGKVYWEPSLWCWSRPARSIFSRA